MPHNYSKLIGKIVEVFGTQRNFAEKMGLSERSVSLKLHGKVGWKQGEIAQACGLLKISDTEIPAYFFALDVQSH